jgi:hypothetical protein
VLSRWLVSGLLLALVCTAPAAAAAATEPPPHGSLLGKTPPPADRTGRALKAIEAGGSVLYHGGPVAHRSTTYAIFWTGPGHDISVNFEGGVTQFLQGVAAEAGGHGNVYSVPVEYGDSSNVAAYNTQFGGGFQDTAPIPTNGCTPKFGSACVSAEQIREQVDGFVAANQLPRGLHDLYVIFLPPSYDICGGSACSYTDFCGYHSWFGSGRAWTLYAVLPWAEPGCLGPYSPNGYPALDSELSVVSHEQIETFTDPLGNSWYDAIGQEVSDKCAWNYGPPLGATGFGQFNQQIAGNSYALQLEWSNATSSCIARSDAVPPPPPGNDLFANAVVLHGRTAYRGGDSTFGATKEPGEPNHAGNEGGASIWYSWTPPRLGTATVETVGSDFDTLLGVYAGQTVYRLRGVAADDDTGRSLQSRVRFIARPDTTYRIAVDGLNEVGEPVGGTVRLRLAERPAPNTRISGRHRIATRRHRARVRFKLSASPRTGAFECSVDRRRFRRCKRHLTLRTGVGIHLLKARAIAPGGLRDPSPARFYFRITARR